MASNTSLNSIHLKHWKWIWYSHTFKEGGFNFLSGAGLNPSLFALEKKSKTKKGQIKDNDFIIYLTEKSAAGSQWN